MWNVRQSCRLGATLALAVCGILAACDRDAPTVPRSNADVASSGSSASLAEQVRALAASHGVTPLPPPPHVRPALVRLGQALAFDKVLSGNRNMSCMTCHLPSYATGDARSLPIGDGGIGLGPDRTLGTGVLIPRNAPSVFNMHLITEAFWDGRVSIDKQGRYHTPAGAQLTPDMTRALEFGAASAQALFPVTARTEMRGFSGNELAAIPDDSLDEIWAGLMKRLGNVPEYRGMFQAAYPGVKFKDMNFAYAANAIAGFLESELYMNQSPWDRFLAGDDRALTPAQLNGAKTFLSIRCVRCHDGPAFTDLEFHNVALAQFGPGEGNGPGGNDDFGRFNVTGNASDKYAFRTTPLRNVELTGPYGHAGQFIRLRDFIAHYSNSEDKLEHYDASQLPPALRGTVLDNVHDILATRDTIIAPVVLPDSVIDALTTYMQALTDPRARNLSSLAPRRVPSGLPIDR